MNNTTIVVLILMVCLLASTVTGLGTLYYLNTDTESAVKTKAENATSTPESTTTETVPADTSSHSDVDTGSAVVVTDSTVTTGGPSSIDLSTSTPLVVSQPVEDLSVTLPDFRVSTIKIYFDDNKEHIINLANIKIYDTDGKEIRGNQVATSSSIYGASFPPSLLLDWKDTYAHTTAEVNPWMQVALNTPTMLSKIAVDNRKDACCSGRIVGAKIGIINKDKKALRTANFNADQQVYYFNVAFALKTIRISKNSAFGISDVIVLDKGNNNIPLTISSPMVFNGTETNFTVLVTLSNALQLNLISSITIKNRTDCCQETFQGVLVEFISSNNLVCYKYTIPKPAKSVMFVGAS